MNVQWGAINGLLRFFGLPIIPFLSNPAWSKPSLILVAVWANGAAVVISSPHCRMSRARSTKPPPSTGPTCGTVFAT